MFPETMSHLGERVAETNQSSIWEVNSKPIEICDKNTLDMLKVRSANVINRSEDEKIDEGHGERFDNWSAVPVTPDSKFI